MDMRRLLMPLLVILLATNVLGQSSNPDKWIGTWKLNKGKSSARAPESATTTIEAIPGGIRVVSDSTDRAGITSHTEYSAKFGGRAVPVQGVVPATVAVKRINEKTFEVVIESQGTRTVSRNEISADGKTRKVTQTFTLDIGEFIGNNMTVLVYDKEP
jgi:hypothetical protein